MASKSGIARVSARAVTGVVALGVALVAIAGATGLPLPSFSVAAPAHTVVPVPTAQQRVCPGPILALAADSTAATALSSFGWVQTAYGTGLGDEAPDLTALQPIDDSAGEQFGAPFRVTVPVPVGATSTPQIAASQTQLAAQEDIVGLASAACAEPSPDSWLVGGSSALGETSVILLSNPSAVQATVNLTVYGESGRVNAAGSTGIEVAPGTQRVVPLAGLAPSISAPVVHVQTTGGQVLATMQQSYVSGVTPLGVEQVGTTSAPSTHLVIAGMTVRTLAAEQAEQSGETYAENLPAARILVPGTKPATVRIGVTGEAGTSAGNSVSQTIQPGVVTEVPLDHLADGNFTVTVDSDQPVVVAARTTIQTTTKAVTTTDFSWFVASAPLTHDFLLAVADGPQATLHLENAGKAGDVVTVTPTTGPVEHVTIPAGAAAGLPVTRAGMYTVSSREPLFASVSYTGTGTMSSFAINPPGPLASPITVYPK